MRFPILNDDINDLIRDITSLGSLFFYIIIIFLFLLLDQWQIFVKLFVALILCYTITVPIRLLFFKKRPKKQKYNNILEKITASSFPSLHAMRSVLLAVFMIQSFQNNILKVILLILFLLVIITRLTLKKHYLIDIIGGTLIGIFIWYLTNIITQSL